MRRNARRRTGFSVLELLVVVAVIAICAGLLFPVYVRAKIQAKVARVHVELRGIGDAIRMYCDDNNGQPPLASESCEQVSISDYYELPEPLYRYISTGRFCDPFGRGRAYKYISPGPGYVNGSLSKIKLYVPSDYPKSEEPCVPYRDREKSPVKWVVWSVGPSGGCDLFEFQDLPKHRFPVSKQCWYPYMHEGIIVRLSDGRISP